ncbi:conserved hypothetical protein [Neospora caninum Liverpool]|uniref:Transmembrane protein n=1 Tax=Neospora caninum (strain Liverpool) TaxID=572307 RepID=F0VLL5_NEOCL|nr:conserved hypothetical protein [Neospora caninum Liverpool]CBZ54143.1 conserved hypothetical protein [Neospora caninum Liverpool]CEL68843.1 TPA: hypothetical protein BN1204_045750 [Neospora caninum Liverpool]|eukprot:XP_003884174.1 conserved hypothetical protein [Neospora caninum Liverpool]
MHAKNAKASSLLFVGRLLLLFPVADGSLRALTRRPVFALSLVLLALRTVLERGCTLASSSTASLSSPVSSLLASVHGRVGQIARVEGLSDFFSSTDPSDEVLISPSFSPPSLPLFPNSLSTFLPLASASPFLPSFTSLAPSNPPVSSSVLSSPSLHPRHALADALAVSRRLAAPQELPSTQNDSSETQAERARRLSSRSASAGRSALTERDEGPHEISTETVSSSSPPSPSPSARLSHSPSSRSPPSPPSSLSPLSPRSSLSSPPASLSSSSPSSLSHAPSSSASSPSSLGGRADEALSGDSGDESRSLSESADKSAENASSLDGRRCGDGAPEGCQSYAPRVVETKLEERDRRKNTSPGTEKKTGERGKGPGGDQKKKEERETAEEEKEEKEEEEEERKKANEEAGLSEKPGGKEGDREEEKGERKNQVDVITDGEGRTDEHIAGALGVEPSKRLDARGNGEDPPTKGEGLPFEVSAEANKQPLTREDLESDAGLSRGSVSTVTAREGGAETLRRDEVPEGEEAREGEREREERRGNQTEREAIHRGTEKDKRGNSEFDSSETFSTDSGRADRGGSPVDEREMRTAEMLRAGVQGEKAAAEDQDAPGSRVSFVASPTAGKLQEAVPRSKVRGRQLAPEDAAGESAKRGHERPLGDLAPRGGVSGGIGDALLGVLPCALSSVSSLLKFVFSSVLPSSPPNRFLASLLYVYPDNAHLAIPSESAEALLEEEEVVLSGDPGEEDEELFARKQREKENKRAAPVQAREGTQGAATAGRTVDSRVTAADGDGPQGAVAGDRRGMATETTSNGTPPWGVHFAETFEGEMICFQWNVFNGAFSLALAYLCSPLYRHAGFGAGPAAPHVAVSTPSCSEAAPGSEVSGHPTAFLPFARLARAAAWPFSWMFRVLRGGAASSSQVLKRLLAGAFSSSLSSSLLPLPSFSSSPSVSPAGSLQVDLSTHAPADALAASLYQATGAALPDFAADEAFATSFSPFEAQTPAHRPDRHAVPGAGRLAGAHADVLGDRGTPRERAFFAALGARPGVEGVGDLPLRSTWRIACLSAQALQSSSAVLQSFGCTYTSPASTFVGWILATLSIATSFLHPMLSLFSNCMSAAYDVYALMW